jgi:thymidine kinase
MINTKIYFIYGCMNSGKSLELIRIAKNYEENDINPLILKPKIDTRKPGYVYSRTGLSKKAYEIEINDVNLCNILVQNPFRKVILVEECNFFSAQDIDIIIKHCYDHNVKTIMFFGLKSDFRGQLFEGSKRVLEYADKIEEATSICWCGKKARQNARVVNNKITKTGPTILIDDDKTKVEYRVLCNYHFHAEMLKEDSEA